MVVPSRPQLHAGVNILAYTVLCGRTRFHPVFQSIGHIGEPCKNVIIDNHRGWRIRYHLPRKLRVKVPQVKVTRDIGVERWLHLLAVEGLPVDGTEPRVHHDVLGISNPRAQTNMLVLLQQSLEKIPSAGGNVGAETQGLVKDVVINLSDISGVEWRKSVQHLISDHAQTPPVHGSAVVLFAQYLRGQVLGRATEGGSGLTELDILLAQTKVDEDDVSSGVEENFLGLQIPVDNVAGVEIGQSGRDLCSVKPAEIGTRLECGQWTAAPN